MMPAGAGILPAFPSALHFHGAQWLTWQGRQPAVALTSDAETEQLSMCVNNCLVSKQQPCLAVCRFTALMGVCSACGRLGLALDIYDGMRTLDIVPNLVTYNALIDVYGKLGKWQDAAAVLDDMRAAVCQ